MHKKHFPPTPQCNRRNVIFRANSNKSSNLAPDSCGWEEIRQIYRVISLQPVFLPFKSIKKLIFKRLFNVISATVAIPQGAALTKCSDATHPRALTSNLAGK